VPVSINKYINQVISSLINRANSQYQVYVALSYVLAYEALRYVLAYEALSYVLAYEALSYVLAYEALSYVLAKRNRANSRYTCSDTDTRARVSATSAAPAPRTVAYVSIRQHTSAYVSIRQHAVHLPAPRRGRHAACACVRQHTSAYVSIRQEAAGDLRCDEGRMRMLRLQLEFVRLLRVGGSGRHKGRLRLGHWGHISRHA
jgi:hypothetical protein